MTDVGKPARPSVQNPRGCKWARVQYIATAVVAAIALAAAFAIVAALNASNVAAAERRILQGAESAGAVVLRALLLPTLMLMQTAMSFESSGNASVNAFRQGASGTLRAMLVRHGGHGMQRRGRRCRASPHVLWLLG
jgi:hypothetical protein